MIEKLLLFMSNFSFIYPVIMAYIWIGGAFFFLFSREIFQPGRGSPPPLSSHPRVAILVACYNEEKNIEETIHNLEEQAYPNLEIIAVNDGSSDNTGELLEQLSRTLPRVRVLQLKTNQGKATALQAGHAATDAKYVIVVDADVLFEPDVTTRMVYRLEQNPKLGAVTGNPRIRNRGSLLGRIQAGEFASIIGMIKRAETSYGRLFTVSGCVAAFRHTAVQDVGYWNVNMATEDVDMSWRLQLGGWHVEYEPGAVCWVLMPETLRGLWRQRLRWAQGGAEVLLRYWKQMFRLSSIWMWPIYLEVILSTFWALVMFMVITLILAKTLLPLSSELDILTANWPSSSVVVCITFILQSAFALIMDSRYESKPITLLYWMIWYPLGYWAITACTAIIGLVKAMGRSKPTRASWVSPDRGVMPP